MILSFAASAGQDFATGKTGIIPDRENAMIRRAAAPHVPRPEMVAAAALILVIGT